MKTVIRSALVATALVSVAGVAQAQDTRTITPINQSIVRDVTTTTVTQHKQIRGFLTGFQWVDAPSNTVYNNYCNTYGSAGCRTEDRTSTSTTQVTDASFSITGNAPNNTENASPTVTNAFTIRGNVDADCSFYGSNAEGRDINLGTIGIRTGNNEAVGNMFNMRAPASVSVVTTAAGCNTNNTVTIQKDDLRGLVNNASVNFDDAQFQRNLPYSVNASFTGVGQGSAGGVTSSNRAIVVAENADQGSNQNGAWRSGFSMDITVPTPSKGLIAGEYRGTVTVTMAAAV